MTSSKLPSSMRTYFNSHAHVERDNAIAEVRRSKTNFNSHAHVERDQYVLKYFCRTGNFNSHAHVERDSMVTQKKAVRAISTHTLTWSVTNASISYSKI